jgi:hypothetical protein
MKPDCLIDRDLILLHYGEAPDGTTPAAAAVHLAACGVCRARSQQLATDLSRIPAPTDPGPAVATRIAARVNERLKRRYRWLPLAGAAAASAMALAMSLVVFLPTGNQTPSPQPLAFSPQVVATLGLEEVMPDIDFLEDLELIRNLELLQQIEGG